MAAAAFKIYDFGGVFVMVRSSYYNDSQRSGRLHDTSESASETTFNHIGYRPLETVVQVGLDELERL